METKLFGPGTARGDQLFELLKSLDTDPTQCIQLPLRVKSQFTFPPLFVHRIGTIVRPPEAALSLASA